MTPKEWTEFAVRWMRDPTLREEVRAGNLDEVANVGFSLDATDTGLLLDLAEMYSDDDIHRFTRPWAWSVIDGILGEFVAKFEATLATGTQTDLENWIALVADEITSLAGPFSGIRTKFKAMGILDNPGPATGGQPNGLRFATAWTTGPAAQSFRDILLAEIMPGGSIPPPPTNALQPDLFNLTFSDRYDLLAIRQRLKIIRGEWLRPSSSAGAFDGHLNDLFTHLPVGNTIYKAGMQLFKGGDPSTFQVLAAYRSAASMIDAENSWTAAVQAWHDANPPQRPFPDSRQKWELKANHVAGGASS